MNMLQNSLKSRNIINKVIFRNTIKERIIEEEYTTLKIKKYFKSINCPELYFTNFYSSKGSPIYKVLKEMINDYNKGINIIAKYFEAMEIEPNKGNVNRLIKILSKSTNIEIKKSDFAKASIQKYNCMKEKNIRFYIKKENGGELNLYLADIFHLAITAKNKSGKYCWKEKYETKSKNKNCISDLLN